MTFKTIIKIHKIKGQHCLLKYLTVPNEDEIKRGTMQINILFLLET